MSSREEQVMALARRAWQAGSPTDDELEAGAARVRRRMRTSARPKTFRRPAVVLAFAVVFIGALAYASSGGRAWFGSSSPKSAPNPVKSAVRAGLGGDERPFRSLLSGGSAAGQVVRDDSKPDEPATPAAESESSSTPTGGAPTAKHATSAAPASSWRDVDKALDARDDARAKSALEGLAKSDDAGTRAKARLGLAQLARSRGDCATARRLALEVSSMPGVEVALVKRAQAIILACD